jgi:hypothetical protein
LESVSTMMTEDSGELVPSGEPCSYGRRKPPNVARLAFNLEKIALVVPDRRVVQALKKAAKAARGDNTSRMVRALAAATQSVERHLPEDYFPELWKLVASAPSTTQ